MTADKWDSADGQTHDESELMATDAEIARKREVIRDSYVSGNVTPYIKHQERILNRLAASEKELAALRAKVTPTRSDRECAKEMLEWTFRDDDNSITEFSKKLIADHPEWVTETEKIIAAHVAPIRAQLDEAVGMLRRYRKLVVEWKGTERCHHGEGLCYCTETNILQDTDQLLSTTPTAQKEAEQ